MTGGCSGLLSSFIPGDSYMQVGFFYIFQCIMIKRYKLYVVGREIMEKIAHRIADILVREKIISGSMFEIYQYGLLRMLEMGGVIITAILLCLCMNMVVEGIVFFIFFSSLRSYLGGIHLKKYWHCFLLSCLVFALVLVSVKYMLLREFVMWMILIFCLILIGLEAYAERKRQNRSSFIWIIGIVQIVVLLTAFICSVKGWDSAMMVICCAELLAGSSKLMEEIRIYRMEKK